MFKKQLVAVLAFGLLSAALIAYSVVNVSGSSSSFENSGYVHVSASDNSNKRVLFNSGTTYKKKVGDVISFSDSTGEQAKVDLNNFIHYDDSSVSSFVEGILVDLDALSSGSAMEHYALPANAVLSQSGSSYTILNSSDNYSFKNVIWKISDDKYILLSPSIQYKVGDEDERSISNYAEVSYVGDSLIQVQTEDNIWQTISTDAHLVASNGLDLNLSNRTIQSNSSSEENQVLLDFSRIVIDGEGNVEISPLVGTRKGETVIPHFNITAEDGADGVNGTAGTNGAAGTSGTSGVDGGEGQPGEDGEKGNAGDIVDGEVKDFPVFTVIDWTISNTGCSGKVKVTEKIDDILDADGHVQGTESSMLVGDVDGTDLIGAIVLIDLETSDVIYEAGLGGRVSGHYNFGNINNKDETIEFGFTGLKADHSYMLQIDAPTSYDGGSTKYLRPYVSKTFWTDSLGVYLEKTHSTETSIGFDVVKQKGAEAAGTTAELGYVVFDSYDKAMAATIANNYAGNISSGVQNCSSFSNVGDNKVCSCNFGGNGTLTGNTMYYVRLAYDIPGDGNIHSWSGLTSQILEVPTLKRTASITNPILRANQNIFGFNIEPGLLVDKDNSFISYTYEFYEYKETGTYNFNSPLKSITTTALDTFSVAIGNELRRGTKYVVRTVGTFNDNEKIYSLASSISNPAMLEQSQKPNMFFVGNTGASSTEDIVGTNVSVVEYDSIIGRLVVQPGSDGAYLGLERQGETFGGQSVSSPTIIIRKDGYYYGQYPIYEGDSAGLTSHASATDKYMTASMDENHVVTIWFTDAAAHLYGPEGLFKQAGGLQPDSSYDIIVYGDIVDGEDIQRNVQIGRCEIKTGHPATMSAYWTTNSSATANPLADAKLLVKVLNKETETAARNLESYNFQRQANGVVNKITIDLFTSVVSDEALENTLSYPVPYASIELNRDQNTAVDEDGDGFGAVDGLSESEIIDAIFGLDVENYPNGYIFTPEFFFPSLTPTEARDKFTGKNEFTIYCKEMEDYAYDKFRDAQDQYKTINSPGKVRDADNSYYYYSNTFRAGGDNHYLVNDFMFKGARRRACVITEKDRIGELLPNAWSELTHKDSGAIDMRALYNNAYDTAVRVTYYVYDAVDFYAGDRITVVDPGLDTLPTTYKYNASYNSGVKEYSVNQEMYEYISGVFPGTDSHAFQFVTPVHLEGLELAKISIDVSDKNRMPAARFYPMTRAAYISKYGSLPGLGMEDGHTLFFLGDGHPDNKENHFLDAGKNNQLLDGSGHQYVVVWTMECTVEGDRLIFPFDSFTLGNATQEKRTYEKYATQLQNTLIKNDLILSTSKIVVENENATIGYNAYMLIPHSTFKELEYANDMPRRKPIPNAILWDGDQSKSVIRLNVFDNDNTIIRKTGTTNVAEVYRKTGSTYTKNNISGDLKIIVDNSINSEENINQGAQLNSLMNNTNNTSEITVSQPDSSTVTVETVIPIQQYNDKYTLNGAGLHVGTTVKSYITGSDDGNWKMLNGKNGDDLKPFTDLVTTSFNSEEAINETEILGYFNTQYDTNPVEAYFFWSQNSSQGSDYAYVVVKGPRNILKLCSGFRFYFEKGNKKVFIDKLLSNIEAYSDEGGVWVPQFGYFEEGITSSPQLIRFKLSIPSELRPSAKTSTFVLENGTPKTVTYPSFDFDESVKVRFDLLYPSVNSGYKYLLKQFNQGGDYYGAQSFALKNKDGYYSYDDDGRNIYALKKYSYYPSEASDYYYLGSFYHLRLSSSGTAPSLAIQSTRRWSAALGSVEYQTRKNLSTLVAPSDATSYSMSDLVPVRLAVASKTRHELETGFDFNIDNSMKVKTYDSPALPFKNNDFNTKLRTGEKDSTIDMPQTTPYIEYTDSGHDRSCISTVANFRAVSSLSDQRVFFTLSTTSTVYNPNDPTYEAAFYPLSTRGGEDGTYYREANPVKIKMSSDAYISTSPVIDWDGQYAALKNIMMPFNGTTGAHSLQFCNLATTTYYSIVCWRYVEIQGKGFGFVPMEMYIDGAKTIRDYNHETIRTNDIPRPTENPQDPARPFIINYSVTDDINKNLMWANFILDAEYTVEHYLVTELWEYDVNTAGTGNFLTYLYCGDVLEGATLDCDGSNIKPSTETDKTFYIYNHDRKLYGQANADGELIPSDTLFTGLEYGGRYRMMFKVYKDGTGPLAVENYDYENDPDSIFVDPTTIGSDHYLNATPIKDFYVDNLNDTLLNLTSAAHIKLSDVSSIVFTAGSIGINTGTLRNNLFLPVAIWKHADDNGAVEYYDITRFLEYDEAVTNKHSMTTGSLTLNITELNEATGKYDPVFQVDDFIELYIYGRQIGQFQPSSGGSYCQGTVLSEEAINNGNKPINRIYIDPSEFLVGRTVGGTSFVPDYSDNKDPKHVPISEEMYVKLKEGFSKANSSDTFGSLLLNTASKKIVDTSITVGKVSASFTTDFDSLIITMEDYVALTEVQSMEYDIYQHYSYVEGEGDSAEVKYGAYHIVGGPLSITESFASATAVSVPEGKFAYIIPLTDFRTYVSSSREAASRTDEKDTKIQITLKFFATPEGGEPQPVQMDANSVVESATGYTQLLDQTSTVLTCTFPQAGSSNNPFNSLVSSPFSGNLRNFFDSMFGTGGNN